MQNSRSVSSRGFQATLVAGIVLAAAQACSSEGSSNAPTCGPGTALVDDQCVIAAECGEGTVLKAGKCVPEGAGGSPAGQGGAASTGGAGSSSTGGAGSYSTGGAGSSLSGAAGASAGGAPTGQGGSGGEGGMAAGGQGGTAEGGGGQSVAGTAGSPQAGQGGTGGKGQPGGEGGGAGDAGQGGLGGQGGGQGGGGQSGGGQGGSSLELALNPVSLGGEHTCVLLTSNRVRCWGFNSFGQLGILSTETMGDNEDPYATVDLGDEVVVQIGAGFQHTCVLLSDGKVRCWGRGSEGQLGYGHKKSIGLDVVDSTLSVGYVDVGGVVRELSAGGGSTCVVLVDGKVRCWGQGGGGKLGLGSSVNVGDDELPSSVPPVDLGEPARHVVVSHVHTCAILESGKVKCWGANSGWQLGGGFSSEFESVPQTANLKKGDVVEELSLGLNHTCARLDDGTVKCWGEGKFGQMGNAYKATISQPYNSNTLTFSSPVVQLVSGGDYSCARLSDQTLRCWGSGNYLGYGLSGKHLGDDELATDLPEVPLGQKVVWVKAGRSHTCALSPDGSLRCWGNNQFGKLGLGHTESVGYDKPASVGSLVKLEVKVKLPN